MFSPSPGQRWPSLYNALSPGDTVEGYSCPSCIGVMGRVETYFPEIRRLKRKYYETWPDWQVWVDVGSM